jgi:hypothetical protein
MMAVEGAVVRAVLQAIGTGRFQHEHYVANGKVFNVMGVKTALLVVHSH